MRITVKTTKIKTIFDVEITLGSDMIGWNSVSDMSEQSNDENRAQWIQEALFKPIDKIDGNTTNLDWQQWYIFVSGMGVRSIVVIVE